MHTKRVHCFISDETELKISVNSPKNSILFRIYDEKSKFTEGYEFEQGTVKNERCIMKKSMAMSVLSESRVFFVLTKVTAYFLLLFFSHFGIVNKIWQSTEPIFEVNLVFYYSLTKKRPENMFIAPT